MVLAGRTKLRVSKKFLRGDIFLYLLNILANAALKSKRKISKNYSSVLATINHWNWLDDSPPLIFDLMFDTTCENAEIHKGGIVQCSCLEKAFCSLLQLAKTNVVNLVFSIQLHQDL